MSQLRPDIAAVRGSPGHARSRRIAAPPAPQAQQRVTARRARHTTRERTGVPVRVPVVVRITASPRSVILRTAGVSA